jgi:hypothetical protein
MTKNGLWCKKYFCAHQSHLGGDSDGVSRGIWGCFLTENIFVRIVIFVKNFSKISQNPHFGTPENTKNAV